MKKYVFLGMFLLLPSLLFGQDALKLFPESRNSLEYRLVGPIDKGFYFNNNSTGSILLEVNGKQHSIYSMNSEHLEDWKIIGSSLTHDFLLIRLYSDETHEVESKYLVVNRETGHSQAMNIRLAQFIGNDKVGNLYFIPEAEQEDPKFERGIVCFKSPNYSTKHLLPKYQIRDGIVKSDIIYAIGSDEKDRQVYLTSRVK